MAIEWRCPSCQEVSCETENVLDPALLQCRSCAAECTPADSLCVVCDTPNPWHRRTSIHRQCLVCGNRQMIYSHLRSA